MYKFLIKYHKLTLTLVKIIISFLAVYYLWLHRYLQNLWRDSGEFHSLGFVSGLLVFSLINWLLEIKKWQFLVGYIQPVSYKEAARQSLISFALSLLTPNRVGEYGVKILFYKKKDYKNVLGLTFIGNISQLMITLLAGLLGLWYVYFAGMIDNFIHIGNFAHHGRKFFLLLTPGLLIISIMLYLFKKYRQTLAFQPGLWIKSNMYALFRYLVFSSQFVWLLKYFNVESKLLTLYAAVSLVYLFATLIPMLSLFDWAVKGDIAIWIFTAIGINGVLVFKVVAMMWFGNFLLSFLTGLIWMWASKTYVR